MNITVGKTGDRGGDREAQELGPLGRRRSDRHAQSHAARGHRARRRSDPPRQGVRTRHSARSQRAADRAVWRTLEPDPHHAGDRHRRGRRAPGRGAEHSLRRRRHQHAGAMRDPLGFARPHLLRGEDVQRPRRAAGRQQRARQARHRAFQEQDGRPRRPARHRALQEYGLAARTATAFPTTNSTPAPAPRTSTIGRGDFVIVRTGQMERCLKQGSWGGLRGRRCPGREVRELLLVPGRRRSPRSAPTPGAWRCGRTRPRRRTSPGIGS